MILQTGTERLFVFQAGEMGLDGTTYRWNLDSDPGREDADVLFPTLTKDGTRESGTEE